jgi:hypothetical protein
LGDGGSLDALLNDAEHTGRSATPPPDVLLPGMAPPLAGPPAATPAGPPSTGAAPSDTGWLTAGVDLEALTAESLNPDARPAPPPADQPFAPPAAPAPKGASNEAPAAPFAGVPVPPPDLPAVPPAGPQSTDPFTASFEQVPPFYMDPEPPVPAPKGVSTEVPAAPASNEALPPAESFSLSDLLQAGEEEGGGPPMSFAEWLALQGSGTGAGTTAAAPPPVDLANLPAWMRPEPPASAAKDASTPPGPPRPPTAGRKGVLRCPHCGEELDKEEMLRMLAEVWGLDS